MIDQTSLNESIVIPVEFAHLTITELRKRLQQFGDYPGPITPATKNVYLKRLARLHSGETHSKVSTELCFVTYEM